MNRIPPSLSVLAALGAIAALELAERRTASHARRRDSGAERGLGIRHALRRKLRGLSRPGRTRRRGDRSRRSGLSRHRR